MRYWAPFILVCLFLLLLPTPASACSCAISPYLCNAFEHMRAIEAPIFTGTVVGITEVHGEVGVPGHKEVVTIERRIRLVVTESFIAPVPREVEVSSSVCGYEFELGQAYLVHADRTEGRLTVSSCSRTRLLADASDDVELLRGWFRGSFDPRIFGAVTLQKSGGGSDGDQSGLLVVTEAAGHVYQTVTDTRGRFRFRGLPKGQYSVRAWLNDQMTKEAHFEPVLSDGQQCAEVNIHFLPGARVSGRVTDSRGQPVENASVRIKDTRPFEQRTIQGPDRFYGTTDKTGRYEIQGILPGPYTVSVAPQYTRSGSNALPADVRVEPRRLSSAVPRGVLSLSPDQNIENIDIELPRLELATLSISVVRPDGHPAGRGLIEVRQADGRMMLRGFPLNETGSITLQGLVGQSYQLQAYFDDPESHRQLRSESLSIVIERENPLVTLRLRSPQ